LACRYDINKFDPAEIEKQAKGWKG